MLSDQLCARKHSLITDITTRFVSESQSGLESLFKGNNNKKDPETDNKRRKQKLVTLVMSLVISLRIPTFPVVQVVL